MGYLFVAFITFAIVYGLIISRGFRILAVVLVLLGAVWWSTESDKAQKQKIADEAASATKQAKEKIRQAELWSRVSPDRVELRTPQLAPDGTTGFQLIGSIKNLSDQSLSGFEIEVTARDCTSKCETIGHSTEVLWTDIPPHEVRELAGE